MSARACRSRPRFASGGRSARDVVEEHLGRHRGARARGTRVQSRARRRGAGGSRRDRRRSGARRRPRSARGGSPRAEGQHVHARDRDDVLVADPRGLAAAVRRDGGAAPACGRRDRRRQDQSRRVRDGFLDGELGVRSHAQPARPHAGAGGIERRVGGRGRGRLRPARARLRHRRFDPPARGAVRCGRREAHVRRGVALRAHRVRVVARPDRSVRGDGRRRGAAPRSDRRLRRVRLHVDRPPGPVARRRSRRRCIGAARRHRRRDDRDRRHRTARPRVGARSRRRVGGGRRQGRHGLGAVGHLRDLRVLPDRAGGSVVEPGALRRRALRVAGRRARTSRT